MLGETYPIETNTVEKFTPKEMSRGISWIFWNWIRNYGFSSVWEVNSEQKKKRYCHACSQWSRQCRCVFVCVYVWPREEDATYRPIDDFETNTTSSSPPNNSQHRADKPFIYLIDCRFNWTFSLAIPGLHRRCFCLRCQPYRQLWLRFHSLFGRLNNSLRLEQIVDSTQHRRNWRDTANKQSTKRREEWKLVGKQTA